MNEKTVSALREFSLEARHLLEQETGEQLEGIYGLLPSGAFAPAGKYPAVRDLPEAGETRTRLERFLADEGEAGLGPADAWKKLLREAAFTWLNRLVALRMLEARGLLRRTISGPADSNAFKLWLTGEGNEEELKKFEAGDLPQNVLGEGPRQEAYRRFILWQCGELSKEVRVLFDPDTLSSRLFPRPRALGRLFGMMNSPELAQAWQVGSEETVGWIYQFFNEEEKNDVFDRVFKQKEKIEHNDIPAATELFTPRWIVRYLVHNTLGRLWLDMHPDSDLASRLEYLIPLEGPRSAPLKPVGEIALLDPACGSMHFGLLAFDLFAEMYREELSKAGTDGWPESPSVESEADIPAAIIARNISGIDLDYRAVQLSALTLYLKAKTLNPHARIRETRLACADIHILGGEHMDRFIREAGLGRPIYRRILAALQESLRDSEQLGSLLRLEGEIGSLIEREKVRYAGRDAQLDLPGWERPIQDELPGWSANQFEDEAGREEFWEILEVQIRQALDLFASQHFGEGFFAGEVRKGLKYLDLVSLKYDVVVANPPYMSSRNMNTILRDLMKDNYPQSKGDLYAAFIDRGTELLADYGFMGFINQQSFMFISSYEKMRKNLLEVNKIQVMAHLGAKAFDTISGEKVNTTMYVMQKEPESSVRLNAAGIYFRLVRESDGESKRRRFEEALTRLQDGRPDPIVYRYRQSDFDAIPGSPWVYWITPSLRDLFLHNDMLGEIIEWKRGLATGDNGRFIRYWWEVGQIYINSNCRSCADAYESGYKWFPYMKSIENDDWLANTFCVVNWKDDGAEIRCLGIESGKIASRPQNTHFYFQAGITYSSISSAGFIARHMPSGHVFDQACNSIFAEDDKVYLVLSVLNSNLAKWVLNLNPTINIVKDDFARIPLPSEAKLSSELVNNINNIFEFNYVLETTDERNSTFIAPSMLSRNAQYINSENYIKMIHNVEKQIAAQYQLSNNDLFIVAENLSMESVEFDDNADNKSEGLEISRIESNRFIAVISYAIGIVIGRFQPGVEGALGRGNFSAEVSARLRGLTDPDGIMVMDEGHSDDLPARVFECLAVIFGSAEAARVVRTASGKDGPPEELLRNYLEKGFFKEHIQLYRKRPVYWFFQSPKKKFGVWVFHERMTDDTLLRIRTEYVQPKIRLLDSRVQDLRAKASAAEGREARRLEKELGGLAEARDDIAEFEKLILKIAGRGYRRHVDDGVLINLAPLWELLPSWPAEPKKAWKKLEKGDWDWSYQAMDHWPERVREKCKKNKSYAIAHGLEELYEG